MSKKIIVLVTMLTIALSTSVFAAGTEVQQVKDAYKAKKATFTITAQSKSHVTSALSQNKEQFRVKSYAVQEVKKNKVYKVTATYKGFENKGTPDVVVNSDAELFAELEKLEAAKTAKMVSFVLPETADYTDDSMYIVKVNYLHDYHQLHTHIEDWRKPAELKAFEATTNYTFTRELTFSLIDHFDKLYSHQVATMQAGHIGRVKSYEEQYGIVELMDGLEKVNGTEAQLLYIANYINDNFQYGEEHKCVGLTMIMSYCLNRVDGIVVYQIGNCEHIGTAIMLNGVIRCFDATDMAGAGYEYTKAHTYESINEFPDMYRSAIAD